MNNQRVQLNTSTDSIHSQTQSSILSSGYFSMTSNISIENTSLDASSLASSNEHLDTVLAKSFNYNESQFPQKMDCIKQIHKKSEKYSTENDRALMNRTNCTKPILSPVAYGKAKLLNQFSTPSIKEIRLMSDRSMSSAEKLIRRHQNHENFTTDY